MERCRFPCGTACGTARRTPFSARIAEKLGVKVLITAGLVLMAAGLVILAVLPSSAPVQALAAVMVLVGLGGPLVMPPLTAVLLNSVPPYRAGVASGVFNTSRQVGGALAVAVFGALLANRASFVPGVRASLLIAAAVALAAAAASLLLGTSRTAAAPDRRAAGGRGGAEGTRPLTAGRTRSCSSSQPLCGFVPRAGSGTARP